MKQKPRIFTNTKIKDRRLDLDLSEVEVAHRSSLTICELGDIEAYANEVYDTVPLYHVKKLCVALGTDFMELLEISCDFCSGLPFLDEYWLRRDVLIHEKLENARLSEAQVADFIGFEEAEIRMLKTYTAHLESWSVEHILMLAKYLGVPPQILLDVKCKMCGR